MKTIKAKGKYAVSFNTRFGDYECGEIDMHTIDYAGDDIDALVKEVIDDSPEYPMVFRRVLDEDTEVLGVFYQADDIEHVDAVLVDRVYL